MIENPVTDLSYLNNYQERYENEYDIYTWRDATFKEIGKINLGDLLKASCHLARLKDKTMTFYLLYMNSEGINNSGKYIQKFEGCIYTTKKSQDDKKKLHDINFQIGDMIFVLIQPFINSNLNPLPLKETPEKTAKA